MIEVRDLRLGNIVATADNYLCRVTALDATGVQAQTLDGLLQTRAVQPIPLTPELLEQAGFTEETDAPHLQGARHFEKAGCTIEFEVAGPEVEVWIDHREMPHLRYLHQLQNAYYFMLNNELELTL